MTEPTAPEPSSRARRLKAAALVAGGVAAGVLGATAIGASAQDNVTTGTPSSGSTASSTPSSGGTAGGSTAAPGRGMPRGPMGNHQRGGNGETMVTGTTADTLKADAAKRVPGGTVHGVMTDTDSSGSAYEVHVTKSDGTRVELLYDSSLKYLSTETAPAHGPRHGPGGMAPNETTVTGANADTLKAAALAKVPGATVEAVTTDSGDAAYEVHLKKSDGTEVTVKFDKNLAFVAVEDGRGK